MRIAAGGYEHETNTFSNIPVTSELLDRITVWGQELYRRSKGVRTMMGGFVDEAEELGIELIPICHADVQPCGSAEKEAIEDFLDVFVDRIWQHHTEAPLDAIALNIHGAAVAEGYPDVEAELLRRLRARFGGKMPIGMVLDLHGNVTPEMMELSNVTVGYKCYPHVDTYDCGRQVIRLLHEYVNGKKLYQTVVQMPWHIAPAHGVTLSGPVHDIVEHMACLTRENPALRDISFFHGFPYADVSIAGASVTAVAESREEAQQAALSAARYAWSRRHELAIKPNSAAEAMDLAEQAEAPVVINESSDNPGGGAPGDGTHLLREMLRRDLPGSAYGYIHDPEVVQLALAAGVGGRISCALGGKRDHLHGDPVEIRDAYVKTISDGRFIKKNPMGAGAMADYGPTVLLEVGNVSVVVSGARSQTLDDGPFRIVGIDWRDMRILALKSSQHFKGWWVGRAKSIVPCDSPGIHSADLTRFEYRALNRTYFPFGDPEWE